jgi:prepilin-type N-terminal cleavage/methylation domain-containing protein
VNTLERDEGFTLIELLIVVAIIITIAAIAVPGLLRARQSGNEVSAIGSIRAINSAQESYRAFCGNGGYAQTLTDLGLAPTAGVPFITPDLSATDPAVKSGYIITVTGLAGAATVLAAANTCNGAAANAVGGYHVTAVPVSVGSTGQRSFASDNRGTIYQNPTGVVIANPIPAQTQTLQ